MSGFQLVVASYPEQLADAESVRRYVYSEEEQLLGLPIAESYADLAERTTRLVVYTNRQPIGTVSLALARGGAARDQQRLGFDLEASFVLRGFELPGIVPAEVTRFCVLRRYRGTRVAALLYSGLLAESARLGVTHLVAEANMQTDCAVDAALAYALARQRDWTDSDFSAAPRHEARPPAAPTRFVYTEQQRTLLRTGELAAVAPPRTLSLFAQSMRARYIGPPVYEPAFNVFALPLVARLTH